MWCPGSVMRRRVMGMMGVMGVVRVVLHLRTNVALAIARATVIVPPAVVMMSVVVPILPAVKVNIHDQKGKSENSKK